MGKRRRPRSVHVRGPRGVGAGLWEGAPPHACRVAWSEVSVHWRGRCSPCQASALSPAGRLQFSWGQGQGEGDRRGRPAGAGRQEAAGRAARPHPRAVPPLSAAGVKENCAPVRACAPHGLPRRTGWWARPVGRGSGGPERGGLKPQGQGPRPGRRVAGAPPLLCRPCPSAHHRPPAWAPTELRGPRPAARFSGPAPAASRPAGPWAPWGDAPLRRAPVPGGGVILFTFPERPSVRSFSPISLALPEQLQPTWPGEAVDTPHP